MVKTVILIIFSLSLFPDMMHSRIQSPSYARSTERDEGLWPNPYQNGIWLAIVLIPDIVLLPCFYGIRLWIWPAEPLVALGRTRVRRALGTRMDMMSLDEFWSKRQRQTNLHIRQLLQWKYWWRLGFLRFTMTQILHKLKIILGVSGTLTDSACRDKTNQQENKLT